VHLLHQVHLLSISQDLRHTENTGFPGIMLLVENGFRVTGNINRGQVSTKISRELRAWSKSKQADVHGSD
jgi:hypothetical protein